MIAFSLSPDDLAVAHAVGSARNADKVRRGISTRKHAVADSDEHVHVLGAMAEIAVCRWLCAPFNDSILPGGDGGTDLSWGGLTFDVKMRSGWGRDLLILPDMSDFRADIAVLCWPGKQFGKIVVVGLVSRERFRVEARTDILTNPPRLVMPWRELTGIQKENDGLLCKWNRG